MEDLLKIRFIFFWVSFLALNACGPKLEKNAIYGEYSMLSNGVEYILTIEPNGTYTQREKIDGKLISVEKKKWNNYFPNSAEIRYDLIDFKFPSQKETSDWPALLEKRFTNLILCYYDAEMNTKCYKKKN